MLDVKHEEGIERLLLEVVDVKPLPRDGNLLSSPNAPLASPLFVLKYFHIFQSEMTPAKVQNISAEMDPKQVTVVVKVGRCRLTPG